MIENSSKPVETRNSQVCALEITRDWLHSEGGRGRIPTALAALVEATISSVERGDAPPEKDGASLYEIWRLSRGQASPGSRSENSRVGQECVWNCRSWWSPIHNK